MLKFSFVTFGSHARFSVRPREETLDNFIIPFITTHMPFSFSPSFTLALCLPISSLSHFSFSFLSFWHFSRIIYLIFLLIPLSPFPHFLSHFLPWPIISEFSLPFFPFHIGLCRISIFVLFSLCVIIPGYKQLLDFFSFFFIQATIK